jgi:hypothetical protein
MKTLNISHLYYTKSHRCDGEAVFACSETMNKDEKSELEKTVIVGYEAPLNLPSAPTEEKMLQFPTNFAYYKLKKAQKQALLSTTYTGRCNHTPTRFGNFLTHIMMFEEAITNINIPALLNKLNFRTHLTVEEEEDFVIDESTKLVDIEENEIFLNSISFINADTNRKNTFKQVIDKIVDGWLNDEKHRIVIKSNKEEVQAFIFALYAILPKGLINQYSFATYKSTLRDTPFQIVGILSENVRIISNDSLFDLSKTAESYQSENDFTELIFEIINKENPENLDTYFEGYELERMTKNQLNNVVKTIRFKVNVENETLSNFKEIIKNQPTKQKEIEIVNFVATHNPNLYVEFLLEEVKGKIQYRSVEEKMNVLVEFYEKHFNGDKIIKQKFYPDIYCPISRENGKIGEMGYYFFMKFDANQLVTDFEKEDELRVINEYLENYQNSDIDMKIKVFIEKYAGIITEKIPFLYGKKVKAELLEKIKSQKFNQQQFEVNLRFLGKNDRKDILANYLFSLLKIGEFDLNFKKYLPLIDKTFSDEKDAFWKFFFSLRDENRDNFHSLSYVKRHFVVAILEKENYQKIVSQLTFSSFEKEWLIDYFRERGESGKITLLEKLKSYINIR